MTTADELADLLQRSAAGDRTAFATLYAATSGKLFGVILRILRDRDLAADILQEVFVKVWQNAARFDPARASPVTWMASIARNRAIDEARRRTPATVDVDDDTIVLAAGGDAPLAGRERREELAKLLACLDGIGAERRELILLAYCRGMSRDSLAARAGRPVATIKTWLHRGLAQLRGCLGA